MELASRHPPGAKNLEVAPRFLAHLRISGIRWKWRGDIPFHPLYGARSTHRVLSGEVMFVVTKKTVPDVVSFTHTHTHTEGLFMLSDLQDTRQHDGKQLSSRSYWCLKLHRRHTDWPSREMYKCHSNFMVAPCINNIKHFIVQIMHTNYKILRLLK